MCKYTKPLCMAYIDYEKAFDTVETSAAMKAFRRHGVEEIYVKRLEDIYKESTATSKLHKFSDEIQIQKRMIQGNTISPKQCTAISEEDLKNLEWEE